MVFCLLSLSHIALGTRLIYSVYFDENRRRTTVCAPRGGSHLFNEKRPEQLEANPTRFLEFHVNVDRTDFDSHGRIPPFFITCSARVRALPL